MSDMREGGKRTERQEILQRRMPHILQQFAGKNTQGQEPQTARCHTFQHYGTGEGKRPVPAQDPFLDKQGFQDIMLLQKGQQ